MACLRDCCSKKRKPNTGNGNLYSHITTHSDWLEFYQYCCVRVKSGRIDNFVEKTLPYSEPFLWLATIYCWRINLFLALLMPITEKYRNIVFQSNFSKCESLANMIPNLFGIIFDVSLNIFKYILAYFIPIKFTRLDMFRWALSMHCCNSDGLAIRSCYQTSDWLYSTGIARNC